MRTCWRCGREIRGTKDTGDTKIRDSRGRVIGDADWDGTHSRYAHTVCRASNLEIDGMDADYVLTRLGRERGYIGLLREVEIDDSVRSTFTVLREEGNTPCTSDYISELLRLGNKQVEIALRKLIRVGLVEEVQ